MIDVTKIFEVLNQKDHPRKLFEAFDEFGFEIRFVGGCLRDAILGKKEINDIDFAANAKPDEMQKILNYSGIKYFNSGLKHGTITAVFDKTCYEITTLRIDQSCDGRHAKVSFDASWEDDASRRDFTFNAFYMDFQGRFYDFFGGLDDLLNSRLRFIGSAHERITEDYLRILRALRFFNRYCSSGLEDESENFHAIVELSHKLNLISGERIASETIKIFEDSVEPKNFKNLEYFNSLNLTQFIFLEKKKLSFNSLYFSHEILNDLARLSGIQKIALILKENEIEPSKIRKRCALSNKNFAHIKKIYEFQPSKALNDFFLKPKKYIYSNFDVLKEIIILIFFELYKSHNKESFDFHSVIKDFRILFSNDPKEICQEILKKIDNLQKPILPINSKLLIDFGLEGKEISSAFSEFEKIWLDQNCKDFSEKEIYQKLEIIKNSLTKA